MAGQRRSGYTVLELLLVLAIVVITTALAVPLMDGMMGSQSMDVTQDLIRSRLIEMRSRAREESRPYKLTFLEDGVSFKVEPVDGPGGSEYAVNYQTTDQLPKDVFFGECMATGYDAEDPDPKVVTEVIVYPDGTANFDYAITYKKGENNIKKILLNGQTGTVTSAVTATP